jgi:hypothetical protein
VAFPVTDPHRKRCSTPVLPLVRAILSWQVQPPAGQPDWLPVWGNRLDGRIQIRPRPSIFQDVTDLLDLDVVKLPPWYKDVLPLAIPEPDPAPFSLEQAATLARKGKVPAHRFAAPALAEAQAAGFQSQEGLLATSKAFAALDLDLSSILDLWDKDAGDTTYEQLDCLGLDYHRDLLVSTLRIKKPSGFSGPPCSAGSTEYVAFWVDYGNTCQWTYVGTSQVVVHDYDPMPDDGLHYWVGVPASTPVRARSRGSARSARCCPGTPRLRRRIRMRSRAGATRSRHTSRSRPVAGRRPRAPRSGRSAASRSSRSTSPAPG